MACAGIASPISINENACCVTRLVPRTTAYAAGTQSTSTTATVPTVTSTLLTK
ncbi:hypothetical protein [Nocardioides sp. TF02-7]|uniref:hypothetical protein n=1 Tax=Nocardioides sp. TF02-7 TaxID=2917724 RepID=UPI001F05A5B3|nr:hypothetical protein [Nocardioides sp. TF02-7]UMG93148.1 hypothetical protein MF408_02175 [Nocardioides sp. TF02-7]